MVIVLSIMFNRNFPLFNSFGGFYPRGNESLSNVLRVELLLIVLLLFPFLRLMIVDDIVSAE